MWLTRKLCQAHASYYIHVTSIPAVSPAAFVCYQLCADNITHGQPVVRRVQFPSSIQDSTGATFAQEARTRQGADVQLLADIQPDNHLEGDRTAGARQFAATPALISETLLYYTTPPRALCSSDAPTLVVPRIHTELASRVFSVAAPSTWNSFSLSNAT